MTPEFLADEVRNEAAASYGTAHGERRKNLYAAADLIESQARRIRELEAMEARSQAVAENITPGPELTTVPEFIAWLRDECLLFDWSDHVLHKTPCIYARIAEALECVAP